MWSLCCACGVSKSANYLLQAYPPEQACMQEGVATPQGGHEPLQAEPRGLEQARCTAAGVPVLVPMDQDPFLPVL